MRQHHRIINQKRFRFVFTDKIDNTIGGYCGAIIPGVLTIWLLRRSTASFCVRLCGIAILSVGISVSVILCQRQRRGFGALEPISSSTLFCIHWFCTYSFGSNSGSRTVPGNVPNFATAVSNSRTFPFSFLNDPIRCPQPS